MQRDRDTPPKPASTNLMRAIRALAARLRNDNANVATVYAKASADFGRACALAVEAGNAAAKASNSPCRAPIHS